MAKLYNLARVSTSDTGTLNATVTITNASPAVVSWTAHGFSAGRPVVFTTSGSLPTGLTAGTTYYVMSTGLTTNAFQVSATSGGSAVNTSSAGSGTHTGQAAISLGAAVSGFLTFANANATDGDSIAYAISDGSASWIGTGTYYSTGPFITVGTTSRSTNSNAMISLSGSAQVFITPRKEDIANLGQANTFTVAQTITDATASTSTSTGALIVTGGIGSAADINWTGSGFASFSPTVTSSGGPLTSYSITAVGYKTFGKLTVARYRIACTDITGASGRLRVSLPNTAASLVPITGFNSSTNKAITGLTNYTSSTTLDCVYYDGTFPAASGQDVYLLAIYDST